MRSLALSGSSFTIRSAAVMTILCAFAVIPERANAQQTNHVISGFRFTACSATKCFAVSSPKAWLSLMNGGFSTNGPTDLEVLDRTGQVLERHQGVSASFNPRIDTISLDLDGGGFALLTVRDESLSIYKVDKGATGGQP